MGSEHTHASADWILCKDMAKLAHRCADRIRRDEGIYELETRLDEQGRVLIDVGDLIRIGRVQEQRDRTIGTTPGESVAIIRSRENLAEVTTQLARAEGSLQQAQAVVDTLLQQLSATGKQLAKPAGRRKPTYIHQHPQRCRVRAASGAEPRGHHVGREDRPTPGGGGAR